MPLPHGFEARLCTVKYFRVAEQPICKNVCEMLGGGCGSQLLSNVLVRVGFDAVGRAYRYFVDKALHLEAFVEQGMNAAVGGLLPYKALHFFGKFLPGGFVQLLGTLSHRVNKKLLAHRKTHREGIEKCRLKGITTAPALFEGRGQVNQQFSNEQFRHLDPVRTTDLTEQSLGKLMGIEGLQIVQLLTHPNKVNRNSALTCNGAQHASFGGAVKFGHHQAR